MRNFRKCLLSTVIAGTVMTQAQPSTAQSEIEEILVTATRHAKSVLEVPFNISAYDSAILDRNQIKDMADLSRLVPGMAFTDTGPVTRSNANTFILRGLNASPSFAGGGTPDQAVPTVSTYLGETPVFFPITIKDIERVEVLRGPQGTLYGSGSSGGTIRFIPKRPDLSGFYGEASVSASRTDHSGEQNHNIDAVVNIPLVDDRLAFRASAGRTELGGFIDANSRIALDSSGAAVPADPDNFASGFTVLGQQEDVNDSSSWFVRTSLLFKASENVDVVIGYHHQYDDQDDQQIHNPTYNGGLERDGLTSYFGEVAFTEGATVFPGNDDYEQSLLLEEPYEREVDLYNIDVEVDFGFASFTSATSYYKNESDSSFDDTGLVTGALLPYYNNFPRMIAADTFTVENTGFAQEIRLVSSGENRFDYVVGVFYQDIENDFIFDERSPGVTDFAATLEGMDAFALTNPNPDTGDQIFRLDRNFKFEDIAIFGELTYHITDRWQATAGVRAFWQEYEGSMEQRLPYCGAYCSNDGVDPLGTTRIDTISEDFEDQIYKFNTSYDLSEDLLIYFTFAEGFRRGGINAIPTAGVFASPQNLLTYQPDKATNYEIGLKGTFAKRVNFTLAAFHIVWDDFQFEASTLGGFDMVVNGSEAESQGVELELLAQLTDGLSLSFGYSYTDAEVTEDFVIQDLEFGVPVDSIPGFSGDPLPGVPKHSGSLSLDYVRPLSDGSWELSSHLGGSYRGETDSDFSPSVKEGRTFFEMDSFSLWDASVALSHNRWSFGLFADNLFNEEGVTGGFPAAAFGPQGAYTWVTRPTTIGLEVSYKMK